MLRLFCARGWCCCFSCWRCQSRKPTRRFRRSGTAHSRTFTRSIRGTLRAITPTPLRRVLSNGGTGTSTSCSPTASPRTAWTVWRATSRRGPAMASPTPTTATITTAATGTACVRSSIIWRGWASPRCGFPVCSRMTRARTPTTRPTTNITPKTFSSATPQWAHSPT